MFRLFKKLFNSPESLVDVTSRDDLPGCDDSEERILIDEDGSTSVNIHSAKVKEDFSRHVAALRTIPGPCRDKLKK